MKNIITSISAILVLWVFALNSYAQAPANYYTSAQSLSGYAKKTALYNIINKNYPSTTAAPISLSYGALYAAFQGTGSYPSTGTDKKRNDANTADVVWDMYSDNPAGPDPYTFPWGQTCGNYSAEGDCFNREHSFPQSWFNSAFPMQSDLFHLYPTDGKVNGLRSNNPFGKVGTGTGVTTTLNGGKSGPSISPGYTSTVFEPIDAYKGDFARTYFYMATRYENIVGSWQNNGTANNVLDGSSNQVFDQWQLDLLYSWHIADPVSQKEIDRNNNVFLIQGNRNPYIDNPTWVADIWGFTPAAPGVQFVAVTGISTEPATGNIVYSINITANSTVAFTVNLNVGVASTATSGATNDYVLTTSTPISFAANQTSQTVQVTVNADAITPEADETVILILSSPTASVPLLANSTHTLTIKDYVAPPPVQTPTTIFTFNTTCPGGLGTFSQFSVTGTPVWACNTSGRPATGTSTPNTPGVRMNGGSATVSTANEDWLISPALTITSNYKMDFWAKTRFTGGALGLDVKISTDYTGAGDPNLANWVTLANLEDDNANIWIQNPQIDLSSYVGTGRYVAFIYKCIAANPSQGAIWDIDDIAFYDIPVPVSNFVNFASASTTIREGAQGSLTLLFSSPTTVASTITIKALNGLNVTATDYSTTPALSGSSITVNVPVGASSASFIFNGTEDTDYSELNETVTFVIDAVGAGLTKGSADASIVNMTNYNNPTTALNTFENATKVYPNPAKDKVFVEMAQNQAVAGAFSVEIMDVTGRKIGTVSSDKITSEISVKDWKRGMYFFKFSNNKTQFIKKIVLE